MRSLLILLAALTTTAHAGFEVRTHQVFDDYEGDCYAVVTVEDADGSVDLELHEVDEAGHVVYRAFDYQGDGNVDRTQTSRFHPNGKLAFDEVHFPSGIGLVLEYQFDDQGRLVHRRQESTGNSPHITESSYDADGNLAATIVDEDGDGVPEQTTLYTYVDGKEHTKLVLEPPYLKSYAYHYGPEGHLVRVEGDENDDGRTDYRQDWTYEDDGRSSWTIDRGLDGVVDEAYSEWVDDQGRVLHTWRDDDGDGSPEWEYGAEFQGDLQTREHIFRQTAGEAPLEVEINWTVDDHGRYAQRHRRMGRLSEGTVEKDEMATYEWHCPTTDDAER